MKTITLLTATLVSSFLTAQSFQGKATYMSKRIMKQEAQMLNVNGEKESPEMRQAFEEAFKKATEKNYTLTFTKNEALYEETQELEAPKPSAGGIQIQVAFSGGGNQYMNTKTKTKRIEENVMDKEFLIEDNLETINWQMTNETKKIGEYSCYKAITIIPVSEKEQKEYEEFLEKEKIKPALFKMDEPKPREITAWYTPEIPVNVGPKLFWGLPGLILEITDGEEIILCSKIVLSTKENEPIKIPKKGKKVTQKEFDIQEKKITDRLKNDDGVIIFEKHN